MKTILCIDDHQDGLEVRRAMLEIKGYRALIAASGCEGLECVRAEAEAGAAIDLVLLDYKMEGMDGLEVAQRLRTTDPSLPIILLTGYALKLPEKILPLVNKVQPKGRPATELLALIEEIIGPGESVAARATQESADRLLDASLRQASRTRSSVKRIGSQTQRVRDRLLARLGEFERKHRSRSKRHSGGHDDRRKTG